MLPDILKIPSALEGLAEGYRDTKKKLAVVYVRKCLTPDPTNKDAQTLSAGLTNFAARRTASDEAVSAQSEPLA